MSAEVLREAASLMRERAEADGSRNWMKVDFNEGDGHPPRPLWGVSNDAYFNPPGDGEDPWLAVEVHTGTEATATHIASWHPAVALAVADWLDREAVEHERYVSQAVRDSTVRTAYADERARHALAVARAYLGSES